MIVCRSDSQFVKHFEAVHGQRMVGNSSLRPIEK